MQIENKKAKFKSGLFSALALMAKLMPLKKLAKLRKNTRHIHRDGGPAGHTLATKKFVGGRSASRRARNFLQRMNQTQWARTAVSNPASR